MKTNHKILQTLNKQQATHVAIVKQHIKTTMGINAYLT